MITERRKQSFAAHGRPVSACSSQVSASRSDRLEIPGDVDMDIRAPDQRYNPYRIFSREQWAALRNDTPMTLEPGEFSQLCSSHDRLDIREVEEIYLPLS